MDLFLKDLNPFIDEVPIGSIIYLVRKLSSHVLEMEFQDFVSGSQPSVEVCWKKQFSFRYRLMLMKNEVLAIDNSQTHRNDMKRWYSIYEPQRKILIKDWEVFNSKNKKDKRKFGGKAKY